MPNIINTIICSAIVGIVMSAPMGPIGMLVIQRTLSKGRRPGLFTGIGAAFSDILYCLATGLGISFVVDFIESNQKILTLVGSVVLVIFGIFLFRSNPTRALNRAADEAAAAPPANTYWRDMATGFLLTVSNPLILIITIGLFAQFNLIEPSFKWIHYILVYVCIFGGALLWWWLITLLVSKLRTRFNVRSLGLVNRILGGILIVLAAYGLITSIIKLMS